MLKYFELANRHRVLPRPGELATWFGMNTPLEVFNRDLWTGQADAGTVLKALKPALQGIIGG